MATYAFVLTPDQTLLGIIGPCNSTHHAERLVLDAIKRGQIKDGTPILFVGINEQTFSVNYAWRTDTSLGRALPEPKSFSLPKLPEAPIPPARPKHEPGHLPPLRGRFEVRGYSTLAQFNAMTPERVIEYCRTWDEALRRMDEIFRDSTWLVTEAYNPDTQDCQYISDHPDLQTNPNPETEEE